MEDFNPLVSIVIPVYNGANFLSEAIDSALAQTYRNLEVIVVNDGSTDNGATERIALSYGDKIRYFSKPNGGVSSALNLGIEKMKGEYFSWLSHDDLYAPNKISFQIQEIAALEKKEKIIALCGSNLVNADKKPLPQVKRRLCGIVPAERMMRLCFSGYSINGCSLLIPYSAFQRCGKFSDFKYIQDAEMWFRFFMDGYSFVCGKEILVSTRIHGKQTTALYPELYYKERTILYQRLAQQLLEQENTAGNLLKRFYMSMILKGDYETINSLPLEVRLRYKMSAFLYRCYSRLYNALRFMYHRIVKGYK